MKRVGNIFEAVVESANLELAFWKASRGKRARADQREYAANLEEELAKLRAGLIDGSYPVGNYRRFTVHEPKERVICAAAFRERVLHHALMNVLEPWFEKWLIFDTYACRKGKGQIAAVKRAQKFARKYRYFLKCDIRKFFDSVPHEGIEEMLERKIKDKRVTAWLMKIVDTYETTPGRGLPIGNLTSQHLANLYLDSLDRFIFSRRERKDEEPNGLCDLCVLCGQSKISYVRYMDDFVYWGDDKAELCRVRDAVSDFVQRELGLELKESPYINRTPHGMDFLGMRVYPGRIRANRASLDRFKRKSRLYDRLLADGAWDEAIYQSRMTALTAFLQQADTLGWRRKASGSNRVQRGGSWNNNAQNCRSANRNNNNPSNNNNNNGFRLCCSAAPQDSENRAVPGAVPFAIRDEYPHPRGAGRRLVRRVRTRALPAERHAGGLLQRVQGLDEKTAVPNGKDVATRRGVAVNQPIFLVDEFADVPATDFRHHAAGKREVGELKRRVDDTVLKLVGCKGILRNVKDIVAALPETEFASWRPLDFHGRLRVVGTASRSAWRRARSSSAGNDSPRSISSSAARTSSIIAIVSRIFWKSATSTKKDAARPFCVTRIGRCVRRVFKMQSAIVPRNSESGITSSVKSMSIRGFLGTGMAGVSSKTQSLYKIPYALSRVRF